MAICSAVLQMDLTDTQMDAINPGNYSGSGGAFLLYRTEELGNRVSDIETNAVGYQIGLKGTLKDDFDWEFTFDRNRVKRFDLGVSGYGLKSVANERITDGDFNPFNQWDASTNSLEEARFEPWEESVSTNEMYEFKVSGEIMDMANGLAQSVVRLVFNILLQNFLTFLMLIQELVMYLVQLVQMVVVKEILSQLILISSSNN